MISLIKAITADSVTVVDPFGQHHTIGVQLTPRRKFLTKETKRSILATGITRWCEEMTPPELFINATLENIRRQVLAYREGKER